MSRHSFLIHNLPERQQNSWRWFNVNVWEMKVKLIFLGNLVDFLAGSRAQPAMLTPLTSPPFDMRLTEYQQEGGLWTRAKRSMSTAVPTLMVFYGETCVLWRGHCDKRHKERTKERIQRLIFTCYVSRLTGETQCVTTSKWPLDVTLFMLYQFRKIE